MEPAFHWNIVYSHPNITATKSTPVTLPLWGEIKKKKKVVSKSQTCFEKFTVMPQEIFFFKKKKANSFAN